MIPYLVGDAVMKKLALLFLVLPLPAFASPAIDQLHMQQANEARTVCTTKHQGPDTRDYMWCVNDYLMSQYGWRVVLRGDGSLRADTSGSWSPTAAGGDAG